MALSQSCDKQEIEKIRKICSKNNLTDTMIKALPNSAFKKIISTNKATIRLKN